MKRDFKNLNAIFYLIKKKFIIETYETFLEEKETEEINYSFGEKIIDRLNDGNEEICFCLKYFIFTSEICIPFNDNDISTKLVMAVDLLKDIGYFNSKKISLFELIMFSGFNYKSFNLDKMQINFIDTNLYSKYAIKLGYSKGDDWLTNNSAALFVDFHVCREFLYLK
jgi:hypothetical protein